jgi:hypothetical protein
MSDFNHVALIAAVVVQEIKFEPNVMCEPVDENLTFNRNQV